ncbi:MAG TPA: 30S ribosomal protein S3 [Thermoplasmata archaeon]
MASERKFVTENIRRHLLKEYLMSKVGRAGFGGLDVQRTPMGTRVTLITERPGLVIGRRGEAIKSLTRAIEEDFNFNNPQIEVQEVENPNLNAQIMSEKLANALERGWHFRRAGHSTVRRIMESGARGCQVIISGKLTGQRHRTEKFKDGHIKYCGQAKLDWMAQGFATAKMKPGVIGITVQIMHPNAKLPDEIEIFPPPAESAPAPKPAEADAAAKEKAEDKKAAEAVETLKKAAAPAGSAAEVSAKTKRPRKKKEGEAATPAEGVPQAPAAPGDEKKVPRKRKRKDAPAEGATPQATTEAITVQEPQPLAEAPVKKEEKKPEEPKPAEGAEEKKEA